MPAISTALIWALLVLANVVSFFGALRWRGSSAPPDRRSGLLWIGVGATLELAAILLLVGRYAHRL